MSRLVLLALIVSPCLFVLAAAPSKPSAPATTPRTRVPLTTSRVVGWPDPPPPYRTRRVFEKLTFKLPVALASHPVHDRLFVVELKGNIASFRPGDAKTEPFCQMKDVDLYSFTFHPNYEKNRLVYLFANGPSGKKPRRNQIHRFKVVGNPPRCDPASQKLILDWESNGHNGGDLAFGPDGKLFISAGDGTSDSDTDVTGQDLRDLCSGMIRIDVDKPAPGKQYSIPPDNPFLTTKGARPELWSFGFRNPWRITFDRKTGDLYIGDVGQDWVEMIWLGVRGGNHGWSVMEGNRPFHLERKRGPGTFVKPLVEHPHSESRSITGGVVYHGKKFPSLVGVYLYGDYSTGKIWGIRQKGGKVVWKQDIANTRLQMVGFGTDNDGEVYIVDHTGLIHTLEPAPVVKNPPKFPRRLTETGLFTSVVGYKTHPALVPYDVNSPLWSDGAHKERHLALPGLETIGFTETGPWKLPERTVLVKTFAIDQPDGVRRRIETRLLTLQEGEWYGYSYIWNAEQTDAELVETTGRDHTYTIRDLKAPGGKSDLKWRYPSRVECMVCHTRAARYVLGLTTPQLNRDFDYPEGRMNQLIAMGQRDLFRFPRARHHALLTRQIADLTKGIDRVMHQGPLPLVRACGAAVLGKKGVQQLTLLRRSLNARLKRPAGEASHLPKFAEDYARLANPYDASADVTARARSYLHSNCSHCHVAAGGGNSAMVLNSRTALEKMVLVGEKPLHDRLGIPDALLVAPGKPDRSILFHRLNRRGKGQMPPLASERVDQPAVDLFREWIRQLK